MMQTQQHYILSKFDLLSHLHAAQSVKAGGSSRSHQQASKSKPSPSSAPGDAPTRTSQRSIKRPRTYDEDNLEFESPPSASKGGSKKPKNNPKGSKSIGSKSTGSTVPKVSDCYMYVIIINEVHVPILMMHTKP